MTRLRQSLIILSASALGPASINILMFIFDGLNPRHGIYQRFALYISYLQLATTLSLPLLIMGINLKKMDGHDSEPMNNILQAINTKYIFQIGGFQHYLQSIKDIFYPVACKAQIIQQLIAIRIILVVILVMLALKHRFLNPSLTGIILSLTIPFTSISSGLLIGANYDTYFTRIRSVMALSTMVLSAIVTSFFYFVSGQQTMINLLPEILFILLIIPYILADAPMLLRVGWQSSDMRRFDYAKIIELVPLILVLCLIPTTFILASRLNPLSAQSPLTPIINSTLLAIGLSYFLPKQKIKILKRFDLWNYFYKLFCSNFQQIQTNAMPNVICFALGFIDTIIIFYNNSLALAGLGIINLLGIVYSLESKTPQSSKWAFALTQGLASLLFLARNA